MKRNKPDEHKSETLIPIINAIFDNYNDKINDLQMNKAEISDRISANQDKIAVLSERADRLSATNEMLQRLIDEHKIPKFASKIIDLNQSKIEHITKIQIPKLENAVNRDTQKVEKLDKRIETATLKANKLKHLSGVIKSFLILNPAKRREQFAMHMDGMRSCSNKLLENKITVETEKLNSLYERYNQTDSAVEKYKLTEKIQKQKNLVRDLTAKLNEGNKKFSEMDSHNLDDIIAKTEKNTEKFTESEHDVDFETITEAVTTDKTHAPKVATLSRKQMHEQADALKREQKSQPKQQKSKNNNVEL